MSMFSIVGIACGDAAFSMLSEDSAFMPEHLYQYTDEETGETVHICTWEWVDWTDFGGNSPEVLWVRDVLRMLDQHEDSDDTRFGYKMVQMNEAYEGFTVGFNPPGEAFHVGLRVTVDIPSCAVLIL